MANPLPNSLALTTINDNAQIIASDHRNNYAAIQSAVNTLRAALAGGVSGQVLQAVDGTDVQWLTAAPPAAVYRKTTAKAVSNTVTETDLLNGEITVAANIMGTNRAARVTMMGNLINNSGSTQALPRFKAKLGATTLIDTGAPAAAWAASATSGGFTIVLEIANLGAANSQGISLTLNLADSFLNNIFLTPTTGTGVYSTNASNIATAIATNGTAVDTTASQLLAFTVTLPAANASLGITLTSAIVEIV